MNTVLFFGNGNSAFFDENNRQVPEIQESWLLLYIEFLGERGIEPKDVEFIMPDGTKWEVFETGAGYNWRPKK